MIAPRKRLTHLKSDLNMSRKSKAQEAKEIETETGIEIETETGPELETESEADPEHESESEPETDVKDEPETGPEPDVIRVKMKREGRVFDAPDGDVENMLANGWKHA